jgi:CHAT domain-containing protein/tetratricopeptide (TPR) repeat protein
VNLLVETFRQRVRIDIDDGMRLAEAALAIATELGDAESLGLGCRAKANALWQKNDLRAAVEMFDRSIAHFEQTSRTEEIGRTLSSSIQALSLLGQYERALKAGQRARDIFSRIPDVMRLARLEINVANIYHRQDRFAEALASYQRAYDQLLPLKDAEGTAVALHNIAVCLIALNDFERALDTWGNAREAAEKNGMPLLTAQADYNIACLYFMRGDYEIALDGLRSGTERCRQNGDAYHAALCDLDQSEIYIELNLPGEAVALAQRAREEFERLGMAFEIARSIANLAIARHQQHDPAEALSLFGTAAALFQTENNEPWQALIHVYQALVLFETGNPAEALRLADKALAYFEASRLHRRAVVCHLLIARVFLRLDDLSPARGHCVSALEKLARLEAPLLSYEAYLLLGKIELKDGERRSAYQMFQKARVQLETLRGRLQGEELKISFFKNKLEVYENLIALCLAHETPDAAGQAVLGQAFFYMEQAKSRTLLDLMAGHGSVARWRAASGPDAERARTLRSELNWYYRRIETEQTSSDVIRTEHVDSLRLEARRREDELVRLLRELPGSEQDVFTYRPAALTLEQIRNELSPHAAILEYSQIGDRIIVAILSRETIEITELGMASEAGPCIRSLYFQLSKPALTPSDAGKFRRELLAATDGRLAELYRFLIAPIARSLLAWKHLIIVPHGVLHSVPFHALSCSGEHLIDRFTISYAPSASVYCACVRRTVNSGGGSLVLGVSDSRTPWIEKEVRSIASVLSDPAVYTGPEATIGALRAAGPGSRLIHLAAHGYFRKDNPMFSSVSLGDAHLSLHELYDLRLPVELFTLSGCSTGLNVVAEGDELLGMMRGLLATGAQSLLLSLWDVHDQTTATLMSCFYDRLRTDPDKARALKDGMLEIRETRPHPYYWAPFILVGKAF